MINHYLQIAFLLVCAHALCDGPLQAGSIAQGKGAKCTTTRVQALVQHGLIHGGAVALVTGVWWLGAAEALLHPLIDNLKARGHITHIDDQFLHMLCKLLWFVILLGMQWTLLT